MGYIAHPGSEEDNRNVALNYLAANDVMQLETLPFHRLVAKPQTTNLKILSTMAKIRLFTLLAGPAMLIGLSSSCSPSGYWGVEGDLPGGPSYYAGQSYHGSPSHHHHHSKDYRKWEKQQRKYAKQQRKKAEKARKKAAKARKKAAKHRREAAKHHKHHH